MDQHLATVIIAIITGVFSVITLIIQRGQSTLINEMEIKSNNMASEKLLTNKLGMLKKKRDFIIEHMMLLLLDTTITIIRTYDRRRSVTNLDALISRYEDLMNKYDDINFELSELYKEYENK